MVKDKIGITARDYDMRVLQRGAQHHIDTYYVPTEKSAKRRIRIVIEAIDPRAGETILDIGCGVGTFAFHSSKAGASTVGMDYSKESVVMAKKLTGMFGMADAAVFVVADAAKPPFKGGSFDKVVAADFIEHITLEEKEAFLGEIRRLLKNGGAAVIFTPNRTREKIGELYWRARHFLFKDAVPMTDLHFGLTTKREFEKLLKRYGFSFSLAYRDVTRPYLAKIPLVRNFLALNLLWVIKNG